MIRFLAKVAAQRLIGAMPGGRPLYAALQRHVTRSSRLESASVAGKLAMTARLMARLRQAGRTPGDLGAHLEIGTGWHPVLPLMLWHHGMARQHLTDIRPCLSWHELDALVAELNAGAAATRPIPPRGGEAPEAWLERLGIRYAAPQPLPFAQPASSVGLVSAHEVLCYPPLPVVRTLLAEAARLLVPGGLMVAETKLYDLYVHADPALPRFHFLRYSARQWQRWFDNPMTPQNRLRASDFLALVDALPFDVLAWDVSGGGERDLIELARSRPHPEFDAYPRDALACTALAFVLRRR